VQSFQTGTSSVAAVLLSIHYDYLIPGKMFPTQGDLHIAPFTDETLYMEQCSKANFWYVNKTRFFKVFLSTFVNVCCLVYFAVLYYSPIFSFASFVYFEHGMKCQFTCFIVLQ